MINLDVEALKRVDRVENPTHEEFMEEYVSKGRPVAITGAMDTWAALHEWNPAGLRDRIGDKEVNATRREGGVYRTPDHVPMTVSEYVDILEDPERRENYYLTGLNTAKDLTELADDIDSPRFLEPEWTRELHVWVGYDSRTINHYHSHHEALLCQIIGKKQVLLYPPSATPAMYSKGFFASDHNCSRVDAHDPDLDRFPRFQSAEAIECTLGPGEALFIPVHWWHAVYGLELSISGTYFWPARLRDWHFPNPGFRCSVHLANTAFRYSGEPCRSPGGRAAADRARRRQSPQPTVNIRTGSSVHPAASPRRDVSDSMRSMIVVAGVVWGAWLIGMTTGARWEHLATGWFMSVTMAFGSFLGAATSSGGGAVAFPVMTLAFDIEPSIARDFALMIQSIGMSAAAIMIFYARIPVEPRPILWSGLGGVVGIVLGLETIAHRIPPDFAKILFASTWLAFGFALYEINRYKERQVHESMQSVDRWAISLLVGTGVLGGIITSITGSGMIAVFALLVLGMGISEKVATPTSVVLLACNALVGFSWQGLAGGGLAPQAWGFWWACVPVVVVGGPLGSRFIRNRSRRFIAGILYVSILAQFTGALLIIPMTPVLLAFCASVSLVGVFFFRWMARRGGQHVVVPQP